MNNSEVNKSLYRKYRPVVWNDVCGQENVVRILKNTLISKQVSHAYLFCGPRGTGKTSSAKIFAKTINCDAPREGEPCGECKYCISFQAGTFPDFFELDAASNRGIDDFREIRDQVQYPPMSGKKKFKVFVIDEAHMLTVQASNAFLKTLEEPPPYIVFILATTEPEKLLATILSRCIRLDFGLLSHKAVEERLNSITEIEGVKLESAVSQKLIQRGAGGMRDTLTLLEQAIHFCGDHIELNSYLDMMGLTSLEEVDHLLEYWSDGKKEKLIPQLKSILQSGKKVDDLFLQMIERIQNYIHFLLRISGDYPKVPQFLPSTKLDFWVGSYHWFLSVLDSMKHSLHPELHGELGLLKEIQSQEVLSSTAIPKDLENRLLSIEKRLKNTSKTVVEKTAVIKPRVQVKDNTLDNYPEAQKNWILIQRDIKVRHPLLFALIEPAQARDVDGKFCLYYSEDHSFHYKKVQDERNFALLSKLVDARYGSEYEIEIILGDIPGQESVAPKAIVRKSNTSPQSNNVKSKIPDELKKKLLNDQGLSRLITELGAEIKKVD
ncbi:DNA polymerase III subunit gamma/tau [bacterium]|nr:DNA polymerase III subunit gamma/tau [bacterium]